MNVTSVWQDYNKLYLSEEAIKEKEMRKEGANRFEGGSAEQFEMDYNQEQEVYMEKNIIAEEKIVCYLKNMSRKMRSELKTK